MSCMMSLSGFFFFSSRRRHTRFDCDWSSDVCSSDLRQRGVRALPADSGDPRRGRAADLRSEEHTSELQSQSNLVCRLLLEKKKTKKHSHTKFKMYEVKSYITSIAWSYATFYTTASFH